MLYETPQSRDGSRIATVSTRTSSALARLEQRSTRIVFFIAGFGML
jgi:hypothetical protein